MAGYMAALFKHMVGVYFANCCISPYCQVCFGTIYTGRIFPLGKLFMAREKEGLASMF